MQLEVDVIRLELSLQLGSCEGCPKSGSSRGLLTASLFFVGQVSWGEILCSDGTVSGTAGQMKGFILMI